MTSNNELNISSSSNDVFGASSREILQYDTLDDLIDTNDVLNRGSSNNDNSFGNDCVPGHSEEIDDDEIGDDEIGDDGIVWEDGPIVGEDGPIVGEDGPIVGEDDTIVIYLPSYTLISGDIVRLPVALWGEKNIISKNFVFDTGAWLQKVQDEDYMEHKGSINSHYLYEQPTHLTNIVNDSYKVLVDVVERLYERRYDYRILRDVFLKLKYDKDYTTEMAASHLKDGLLEVGWNGFIDWSFLNSRKRKRN